jgi:hypothetical protein
MPKKLKLDLKGLKVQSFVTSVDKVDNGGQQKIKAGLSTRPCSETCGPCYTETCYTNCTCASGCATCETECDTCETCTCHVTCPWKTC